MRRARRRSFFLTCSPVFAVLASAGASSDGAIGRAVRPIDRSSTPRSRSIPNADQFFVKRSNTASTCANARGGSSAAPPRPPPRLRSRWFSTTLSAGRRRRAARASAPGARCPLGGSVRAHCLGGGGCFGGATRGAFAFVVQFLRRLLRLLRARPSRRRARESLRPVKWSATALQATAALPRRGGRAGRRRGWRGGGQSCARECLSTASDAILASGFRGRREVRSAEALAGFAAWSCHACAASLIALRAARHRDGEALVRVGDELGAGGAASAWCVDDARETASAARRSGQAPSASEASADSARWSRRPPSPSLAGGSTARPRAPRRRARGARGGRGAEPWRRAWGRRAGRGARRGPEAAGAQGAGRADDAQRPRSGGGAQTRGENAPNVDDSNRRRRGTEPRNAPRDALSGTRGGTRGGSAERRGREPCFFHAARVFTKIREVP